MADGDGGDSNQDRFDQIDRTLDRLTTLVTEMQADLRQVRGVIGGLHKDFLEHLSWHLRQGPPPA